MATLSSASTYDEIDTEIAANLHYASNDSTSEAKALVTACFWWRAKHPGSTGAVGTYTQFNVEFIDRLMKEAKAWIAVYGTDTDVAPGGPVAFGFEEFR